MPKVEHRPNYVTYIATIHGVDYWISYGIDPVVGWFLEVFDDPHLDPIISYRQFDSFDPYENFECLHTTPIAMTATGFNGKLLGFLLITTFKLDRELWYHVGQMRNNSEPPIRSRGYLGIGRGNPIYPEQDTVDKYVYIVDPNF